MDRELSASVKRRRAVTVSAKILVPASLVVAAILWGAALLEPTLERDSVRLAVVEKGPIESSIEASGAVTPEFDAVIVSPVEARVLKILKRAGDSAHTGDAIVALDASVSALALEKLKDNVALKTNARAQLQANLEAQLAKLENAVRIKRREIESDSNKVEQLRSLVTKNYVSRGDFNQAVIQCLKSKDELEALLQEQRSAQNSARLQQEGLSLEIAILRKEKTQAEQELERAGIKAERKGVLTWVAQTEGAAVHKGEVLAKIADLSTFRVDATVSDAHRSRLFAGQPVLVKAGDSRLSGVISSIQPAIENGIVKFAVTLAEKAHPALRPNLRVDVEIVMEQKSEVLRVKKGSLSASVGKQDIFVLRREGVPDVRTTRVAERRSVTFGISNPEYYEIVEGLTAGDEIIISNMQEYAHLRRISIKSR